MKQGGRCVSLLPPEFEMLPGFEMAEFKMDKGRSQWTMCKHAQNVEMCNEMQSAILMMTLSKQCLNWASNMGSVSPVGAFQMDCEGETCFMSWLSAGSHVPCQNAS